jgi:ribosomal protein S6--L-glutamate ligase
LDWGGEGQTVYFITSDATLEQTLKKIDAFENSGQTGFLLQQYIPSDGKSLRVVVIGRRLISYWRVQPDTRNFYANLRTGAHIAPDGQPQLQRKAKAVVQTVCQKTGINLAGFDVIFSTDEEDSTPFLLEINYFFGRKGLGGSEAYYDMLLTEIEAWLDSMRYDEEN